MSDLPSVRPREVERVLLARGWVQVRSCGSHRIYKHPEHRQLVTVAWHPGDVPGGTLRKILKDAGIAPTDFAAEV
ncbi:MAG: type II toxin-antitoxin system HicA family toxin [Planctomycetota bacterium]